ncbi:hypothetical protein OH77DRAFT_1431565 [Trametes cingulata]|nr:hypothetical protein OH77DRAFT_1431565 [Trametes cingulata]
MERAPRLQDEDRGAARHFSRIHALPEPVLRNAYVRSRLPRRSVDWLRELCSQHGPRMREPIWKVSGGSQVPEDAYSELLRSSLPAPQRYAVINYRSAPPPSPILRVPCLPHSKALRALQLENVKFLPKDSFPALIRLHQGCDARGPTRIPVRVFAVTVSAGELPRADLARRRPFRNIEATPYRPPRPETARHPGLDDRASPSHRTPSGGVSEGAARAPRVPACVHLCAGRVRPRRGRASSHGLAVARTRVRAPGAHRRESSSTGKAALDGWRRHLALHFLDSEEGLNTSFRVSADEETDEAQEKLAQCLSTPRCNTIRRLWMDLETSWACASHALDSPVLA